MNESSQMLKQVFLEKKLNKQSDFHNLEKRCSSIAKEQEF